MPDRAEGPISTALEAGRLLSDAVLDRLSRTVKVRAPRPPGAAAAETPEPASEGPGRREVMAARGREVIGQGVAAAGELAGAAVARIAPVVIDRIDPNPLIERVDVQAVIDRVDVQSVVDRVDVDGVVSRVDVNSVVATVDLNPIIDRVDVDRVVKRVDVGQVAVDALEAVDIGEVIREATTGVAGQAVDEVRFAGMKADALVARIVDVVLRRKERMLDVGPGA